MKTRQSETTENTQIECKVGKEFQQITNRLENKNEKSTETIIRNEIIRMKNKRAANKYLFVADTKHYLDKFWLKYCVIEMWHLISSPDTIGSLYETIKTSDTVVETSVEKVLNITVEEVVKQGNIFGLIIVVYQHQKQTQYEREWNNSMVKCKEARQSLRII